MHILHNSPRKQYIPWDLNLAQECFDANCGPISFAVSVQEEVSDVIGLFENYEEKKYTNFTDMKRVFKKYGVEIQTTKAQIPKSGVALIQWTGPWIENDFMGRRSSRYTHWIAVEDKMCFDLNADEWLTLKEWETTVAAEFIKEIPEATGWNVKYGIQLLKLRESWPMGFARCKPDLRLSVVR